jgi:ParB-like chromosome segregation protein Spo0J
MSLEIQEWEIGRLIPYARNPRKNDEQVDKMAGAIKEFGFRLPIMAKSDGLVVDGHLRLKAAQRLGLESVPVILADDLTDAQIKAFRILVNRSANWAEWDEELLRIELEEIKGMDYDLAFTGFDKDELDALLQDITPGEGESADDIYTQKIEAPIYEPTGEKPPVEALFDADKARALVAEVQASRLPEEVKEFLILAAHRHVVFDYRNIAEFYAHADPETQDLMERSALVIIDFDKAIENGFAQFFQEVAGSYEADHGDAE